MVLEIIGVKFCNPILRICQFVKTLCMEAFTVKAERLESFVDVQNQEVELVNNWPMRILLIYLDLHYLLLLQLRRHQYPRP